MKTALLIPAEGMRCLDPVTRKPLPPEGAQMPLNSYWNRRIADGDVTVGPRRATKARKSAHSAARSGEQE